MTCIQHALRPVAAFGMSVVLMSSAFAVPQQAQGAGAPQAMQTEGAGGGAAPEIDPTALGSLAALLVGGGLLLHARRGGKTARES